MNNKSQFRAASSRVLIVSDNASDVAQIVERLELEFPLIRVSTEGSQALDDILSFAPAVLLISFRELERATRLTGELSSLGRSVKLPDCRRILLCNKDDVPVALQLCKAGSFDDYVLYWPQAQDGLRLIMTVWNAALQVWTAAARPSGSDLISHAEHLDSMRALLDSQWSETEHLSVAAQSSVTRAERAVADALAQLQELASVSRGGSAGRSNSDGSLNDEFNRLRAAPIATAFKAATDAAAAVADSSRRSRGRLGPVFTEAQTTANRLAKRRCVLVVDDDPFARTLAQKSLQTGGHAVLFAQNGEEALELLGRVRPDAILMDVNLPGVDGVALTAFLKRQPGLAGIPVLMFTGEAHRETLELSMQAGAADFIVKPFTPEGLVEKVESVLLRAGASK